jgi:hypothetical protein
MNQLVFEQEGGKTGRQEKDFLFLFFSNPNLSLTFLSFPLPVHSQRSSKDG